MNSRQQLSATSVYSACNHSDKASSINQTNRMTFLRCIQVNLCHSISATNNLSQLILERQADIVLIQEPYAKTLGGIISPEGVPEGYVCFHNLNDDHAYGSTILTRSALFPEPFGVIHSNSAVGITLKTANHEVNFTSL